MRTEILLRTMGWKRSTYAAKDVSLKICAQFFLFFVLIWTARVSHSLTNPTDVAAISNFYVALGSPVLPGWVASGGDPCGQSWQGVLCNNSDIKSIILNGANLRGELGDSLSTFSSITVIDLSNNHIGGSIPSNLPISMQNLFLSANEFTGSIPSSLSSLTKLAAISLNNNLLSGEIPDAFDSLVGLINLDLSSNNLSGHLPPSMENLSALTTLRLQDNQLSGTLDVLQDLPLKDLNIENNLFNGPIPEKILSIPNLRKGGNPFNSSGASLPSPTSPSTPSSSPPFFVPGAPSNKTPPSKQPDGPTTSDASTSEGKKKVSTRRVVWISIAAVFSFIILVLACVLFLPTCLRRSDETDRISKWQDMGAYGRRIDSKHNASAIMPPDQMEKAPRETALKVTEDHKTGAGAMGDIPKTINVTEGNVRRVGAIPSKNSEIGTSALDMHMMPPPPPPPPPPFRWPSSSSLPPTEIVINPTVAEDKKPTKPSPKPLIPPISARPFSIASLQLFTNSFSQENFIGSGMLGSVYRAELSDGKFLAVKKLDKRSSSQQKDSEFLELVNSIDSIRHANVVELEGYCAEHDQRLLIYEYCSNGTLQDALLSDDEFKKKLTWNTRIRMALGAARALEYLHEICQPPIIHRNFKSSNVLLDDDLAVHVSDCGLAALITSGSVSQLSGHLLSTYGYGAPEFESGTYTIKSDVYSFGVVMLELLTGRKSCDRSRSREEQFLVRWAMHHLHDINALWKMVDPSIEGEYTAKSLSRFADIISRCVQSEPEFRPQMSEVVQDLLDMISKEPPP
ncbi:hypothetical protein SAY86_010501 [Trapa natans]|uniref:Protein kinase domain-containing protein n=1 Tax=Trapa natans TaxID=22666 RepID=A0AAN7LTJ4_TRANT|nr:hypothetical protein SAY86_010501 [Trapa natans]